ncbi:hypothetical protein GCM10023192_70620 [Amycolatopsis samaneae]
MSSTVSELYACGRFRVRVRTPSASAVSRTSDVVTKNSFGESGQWESFSPAGGIPAPILPAKDRSAFAPAR